MVVAHVRYACVEGGNRVSESAVQQNHFENFEMCRVRSCLKLKHDLDGFIEPLSHSIIDCSKPTRGWVFKEYDPPTGSLGTGLYNPA
jgi:hypothetical protein